MSDDSRGAATLDKKLKKKKKKATVVETPPEIEPELKEKKAKKRKKTPAPPAAVEATDVAEGTKKGSSETGVQEVAAEKKKGKKRKPEQRDDGSASKPAPAAPTADEEERRVAQREIQQLVVRLRSEGKSKHEIEAAKRDHRKDLGKSLRQPESARSKKVEAWKEKERVKEENRGKEAEAKRRKEAAAAGLSEKAAAGTSEKEAEVIDDGSTKEKDSKRQRSKPENDEVVPKEATEEDMWKAKRKEGLEHKHDLVIIPIIWRGKTGHEDIEKCAANVKAFLAQQGLDVWVDSRRHYTPGQKFAHWEFRGVMLRIEIGPEDFDAGMLKLCKAKEAGDYKSVQKKRLRLPPGGNRRLLLTLKEWGMTQLKVTERDGEGETDEEDVKDAAAADVAARKSGGREADAAKSQDDEDLTGNYNPHVSAESLKKKKKRRTA